MDFHTTQICFDVTNIWIYLFLVTVCIVLVDVLRAVLKSAFALSLYILKSLVVMLKQAMAFGIHLMSFFRVFWRQPVLQIRLDVATYMAILAGFYLMYMEMCYRKCLRNEFEPGHGRVILHKSVKPVKPSQPLLTAFPHVSVSLPDKPEIPNRKRDSTGEMQDFAKLSDVLEKQLNELRDACYSFSELKYVHACMSTRMYKNILPKMENAYFVWMFKHEENFFSWPEFTNLITEMLSKLQYECCDNGNVHHNQRKFEKSQQECVFACIRKNSASILAELRQQSERYFFPMPGKNDLNDDADSMSHAESEESSTWHMTCAY